MSLFMVHLTRMSLSLAAARRKVKVEQWLNIAAMSLWARVAVGTEKRLCDHLICLHESQQMSNIRDMIIRYMWP
jgi:hypothetical protein